MESILLRCFGDVLTENYGLIFGLVKTFLIFTVLYLKTSFILKISGFNCYLYLNSRIHCNFHLNSIWLQNKAKVGPIAELKTFVVFQIPYLINRFSWANKNCWWNSFSNQMTVCLISCWFYCVSYDNKIKRGKVVRLCYIAAIVASRSFGDDEQF